MAKTEITTTEEVALGIPGWEIDGFVLKPIGTPDQASCLAMGERLKTGQEMWQFFLGDWANAVVATHGEKLIDWCHALGLNYDRVRNLAWVSGSYEMSRRRDILEQYPTLSFGHFQDAASKPEREKLLAVAAREEMSSKQFRRWMKESEQPTPQPEWEVGERDLSEGEEYFQWVRQPVIEAGDVGWKNVSAAVRALSDKRNPDHGGAAAILRRYLKYGQKIVADIEEALDG